MTTTTKRVYFFGGNVAEGQGVGKEILGGKGAGLHAMTALGIPVPPGFTLSTEVCNEFFAHDRRLPDGQHCQGVFHHIASVMRARIPLKKVRS